MNQFSPKTQPVQEVKACFFCTNNNRVIDYKDGETLRKFMSSQAKVYPRRKSGLRAYHQRRVTHAIKRARYLALVPFTTR